MFLCVRKRLWWGGALARAMGFCPMPCELKYCGEIAPGGSPACRAEALPHDAQPGTEQQTGRWWREAWRMQTGELGTGLEGCRQESWGQGWRDADRGVGGKPGGTEWGEP